MQRSKPRLGRWARPLGARLDDKEVLLFSLPSYPKDDAEGELVMPDQAILNPVYQVSEEWLRSDISSSKRTMSRSHSSRWGIMTTPKASGHPDYRKEGHHPYGRKNHAIDHELMVHCGLGCPSRSARILAISGKDARYFKECSTEHEKNKNKNTHRLGLG